MTNIRGIAAMLLLTAAAGLPLAGQNAPVQTTPAFGEEIDVSLVLVDATVTDKRGNQILGLRKDDFIIKEDGVEQEIASIDYFTNRKLLTETEEAAAFDVERVREDRYFILFFDKSLDGAAAGSLRLELLRARTAAIEFIDKEMLVTDKVAIAGFDVRLKIYCDFTNNRGRLKSAIQDILAFGPGLPDASRSGEPSILRNLDPTRMKKRTATIFDAMSVLAEGVRPIQARKILVMFTTGVFDLDDLGSMFLGNENVRFRPMVQALNRANVSVYTIAMLIIQGERTAENNMSRLAVDTGGDYLLYANYLVSLRHIENVNNGYYLLTYNAKKPKGTSGYQKIDVSLRNPEFRLKARDGYSYGEAAKP